MNRLSRSVAAATVLLAGADLADDAVARELLELSSERRSLDLSDLGPHEQAAVIAERARRLQPSADSLAARIVEAQAAGRDFVAKLGIDPTAREVHLGHVVPMLVLSRLQRMGHQVVLIVGDVTAKIGDPTGRSGERPPLTDADIARNLDTYREQVLPFFDFARARFCKNGDWLRQVTLPRLIEIASRIPVSMTLQREDFRRRLAAGEGLSLAEVLYSVAMALDSVEVACDLEVGGLDQYLNMQMCRKVMEICGQAPEVVVATALIEGTDGTGAKMSKSLGNCVPLTAPADEVFGRVMSVPDRLVTPWFRALSEWSDPELEVAEGRLAAGSLHPMDYKKLLAADITAALHGVDGAMSAREAFVARYARRSYAALDGLPSICDLRRPVTEVLRSLGWAASNGEVRRMLAQGAVRVIVESGGTQESFALGGEDVFAPLARVVEGTSGARAGAQPGRLAGEGDHLVYLKMGRRLARIADGC